MPAPSRYRPDAPSDYSHRFHAGNVGDVWKHCVLAEVLRAVGTAGAGAAYVESHAGEGTYALGPTGEWTEGIARLAAADGAADADGANGADGAPGAVGRYLAHARALGVAGPRPARYPGSPLFARRVLGPAAPLALWERDEGACARLRAALGDDPRAEVTCGDGLAALAAAVRAREDAGHAVVALVDPPFTQKPDWIAVPDACIAAARATRAATLLLWYPVKSLTRPNAMIARFKAAGVAAAVAELVTTPLEHQRQRLNGSGVVLVRPPAGTLAAVAAAAPILGERCATRRGAWSFRAQAW